jgi:hypothetical protein
MHAMTRAGLAGITLLAMLASSGCSWWKHRRERAAAANAETPAVIVAEPAAEPAGTVLPPDAEALRAATVLATDFYEMRLKLGKTGLPDAGEMKAYSAFLCPDLAHMMDAARARQSAWIAANPEEKPPLIEGDLFSSLFEGPDSVSAAGTNATDTGARVSLAMRAGDGENAPRWKDDLLLERHDGVWCVADVEYHGDWAFANKGRLSEMLVAPF